MARDQNPGKSYRGVDPMRAHEGLVMKVTAAKTTPCIYVSVCGDCSGIPEAIGVHLRSGEVVKVERVVDVRLTESQILLQPAEGSARAFRRAEVYYAGCARCLPPFLS
jgi:hypothetical protein